MTEKRDYLVMGVRMTGKKGIIFSQCGRDSMVEFQLPKLLHYPVQFLLKSLSDLVRFINRLSL